MTAVRMWVGLDLRRKWPALIGPALLVALAFSVPAFAQGGGASSTGTIQGRVTDAQGAVLPGVTVSATSPSALGAHPANVGLTRSARRADAACGGQR